MIEKRIYRTSSGSILSAGGAEPPDLGGRKGSLFRLDARARVKRKKILTRLRVSRDLVAWLTQQGEAYAYAFENANVVRSAIDKRHVRADAGVADASEIAFFPPMSGG
jgi:molybdopterin converting factor small subunit